MGPALHLLLVEDNKAEARLLEASLGDAAPGGFCLVHVSTLAEALDAVDREPPACVLLDLGLPDAEGLEGVASLRARAPNVPIIVLTGRDDERLGAEAVNLGAQDYLTKGEADPRTIVRAVRYAVERDAYTQAIRRSEAAYRLVFAANPQPVLLFDPATGQILAANDAAQAAYGHSADELSRMAIGDLVSPEHRDQFLAALADLPPDPASVAGTWCHLRRGGEKMLVDVSSAEVWFGGRQARMTVVSDVTERERAEAELRASEERYRTIVETANEGVLLLGADLVTEFANERMAQMLRCTVADLVGRPLTGYLPDPPACFAEDEPGASPEDVRFVRDDGSELWALVAASPLPDEAGGRRGWIVMVTDNSERRRAEESQRRWTAIVASSDDAILAHDLQGVILAWNPGAERMFGYPAEDAIGTDVSIISSPDRPAELHSVLGRVGRGERVERIETLRRRRDGTVLPVSMTVSPIIDGDGAVTAASVIIRDMTERWELEAELRRQALHDGLTGLPNRTLIVDRLEQALVRSARTGARVAVLFLDVDRFKTVNDSQGHSRGDELLVLMASRLLEAVREDDTVARLGGDEFVVVCEGVEADGSTAERVAGRINAAMHEPFVLGTTEVVVTVSIGIALGSAGDTAEELLRDADAAMYEAKEQGRARAEMFDEEMRARAERHLALATSLRRAAAERDFQLFYQPVVSLADGMITGAEALLRWDHADHGLMRPASFVPLAEETGLIISIGQWVMETACSQLGEWRRIVPDLTMSVNVSPRQLQIGEFFDTVAACVVSNRIPPRLLVLEITEGVLMENVSASVAALAGLRAAGVSLAVDDFGTGYSSLSYLKRLPIDVLKIDRSFVSGLPMDSHDSAIVSAVLALAGTFGLTVVAEGVETRLQALALHDFGCTKAQGFYFARPMEADQFTELLVRQAEGGGGLPHPDAADQVVDVDELEGRRTTRAREFGLRYRHCPRCGNKGAYLVPARPVVRCKYCAASATLSMAEHALAELNPDPYVGRLRL